MKTVTAAELKTRTNETLATAQTEPVAIEKNGIAVAVIVSQADYDRLMSLENLHWLPKVEAAESSGFIGTDATIGFFEELKGDSKT